MELWQIADKNFKESVKLGRPRKFETPDDLWAAAISYFEWCTDNPLVEDKVMIVDKSAEHQSISKMRAMTLKAFYTHAGIGEQTFLDYEARAPFSGIVKLIRDVMRSQKFEGAAAGMLNPNIIARDLGLAEVSKNEHTGKDGAPIQVKTVREMSDEELLRIASES